MRAISLPASIRTIGSSAFCKSSINDELLAYIFSNCSIEHIGESVFENCKHLNSITIPPSVKSIDAAVFRSSSVEVVKFSQDVQIEVIPERTFENCGKLIDLTLPSSVRTIGSSAFCGSSINDELFAYIFSNCNIEHVGESAFENCKHLSSITIPSSVKSIDEYAFSSSC